MQKLKDPKGIIYAPPYKTSIKLTKLIALLLVLVVGINCYLYLNSHFAKIISGSSMCPNLNAQESGQKDIVLVDKFAEVKRGDIVIIDVKGLNYFDNRNTKLIVKRIIALGGAKIKIVFNNETQQNEVWLKNSTYPDGAKLEEDYINPDNDPNITNIYNEQYNWIIGKNVLSKDAEGYITIPEDYVFFLGDNRNFSLDSRYIGPLLESRVLGVVDKIIYDKTLLHDIVATLLQFNLNF